MGQHVTTFERVTEDDAVEVEVDFTLSGGSEASGLSGPPEHYDPGSAPEFVIVGAAIIATGEATELTEAEAEKVEANVMENLGDYLDDGTDYDDYDRD